MRNYIFQGCIYIQRFLRENFDYFFVIVLSTVLAGFLMNVLILMSSIFYVNDNISFFLGELSILFSLCIIPYVSFKKFIHNNLTLTEKKVRLATWIIVTILVSLFWVDFYTSLHFMIIAISEEVLFREIYYQYILREDTSNRYQTIHAMLIISFVFATVLHINDNFFINIFVRFPLGILLFIIRDRFNLRSAILSHWLYDVIITLVGV